MLEVLLYILFFLASCLLVFIVLIQEGKGGGLTDAFGGAGVETFGVRPGGINRFTFGLFLVFILCALGIHWLNINPDRGSVMEDFLDAPGLTLPVEPGGAPGPPPEQPR